MVKKWLALTSLLVGLAPAPVVGQNGLPKPPKPDIPFLLHANNLIETESSVAFEHSTKKNLFYGVANRSSGVNTPMARPEFVILTNRLSPYHLKLYGFESKLEHREILLRKKKKKIARPYFLSVDQLDETIFHIHVDDILENGEYCLTPDDSNKVFCFTVY